MHTTSALARLALTSTLNQSISRTANANTALGIQRDTAGGLGVRHRKPSREVLMVFTKHLREGIRRGRIRCSIRIWMRPRVKVGGRYRMDDGHIVVDSIDPIAVTDVTSDLARESGFDSVDDLLRIAKHGRGDNTYLIRFHYLPPGAWDSPRWKHPRPPG